MMAKKNEERKPFNFLSESPVIKQTEEKVIKEYDRLEQEAEPPVPPVKPIAQDMPATAQIAPGEPTKNINIALPISLHTDLKIICAKQGQKIKDIVPLIIKEYVDKLVEKKE